MLYVFFIVVPLQTGIFQVVAPPVINLELEECAAFAEKIAQDATNRYGLCMPYVPRTET